jgi:hypothetical protein
VRDSTCRRVRTHSPSHCAMLATCQNWEHLAQW